MLVTNGSMQADAFLFATLVRSGDAVIVERPSYDRTLGSLRSLGADLHAVDVEPDGVSVDGVRAVLDSGVTPALAHLIPTFHNPAGYTLSADKRTQLVGLAREHGFTIFEDDPYVELRFSGERLPTMFEQSDGEVVVRELVLQDRVPRDPRGLPRRVDRADRADREARDQHLHLAQHGEPVDRQLVRARRLLRDDRSRRSRPRSPNAPACSAKGCTPCCPR